MNIKIIDNVLSIEILKNFEKTFIERPWFLGYDGEELENFSLGHIRYKNNFTQIEIYLLSKLKEQGVDINRIKRCYYNCFRKCDNPTYHMDYGRQTYMFYLNKEWSKFWGAPTKFKSKQYHIARSVFPKPGRLVIFDSNIWHKGTAPNILMPNKIAGRMSIAFHEAE